MLFKGVGSEKSECFALDEAFVTPDGRQLEKCMYCSLKCRRQTASSSSHFWATKEMKYVWKFQKLCFRNKDKSRSSKFDKASLILIARSRQRFALSVTTGVFVTATAWADGTAVISISSRVSVDMKALFATSSSKLKRRISSSWVKGLEHIEEFRVGSLRSPLFYEINPLLSPDISLFPGFRRRKKELRVKLNPCAHLGRQKILQQHVYPAYFACYSKKLLSGSPK